MNSASLDAAKRAKLKATLDQLPLTFTENQGQLDEQVAYYIQGRDKTIYFTPQGVTYALADAGAGERWTVKLDFVDANPDVCPTGDEKTDAIVSYFKGSPNEWYTGLPTYGRILYRGLWPGIDLIFYGTVNQLKYEFIVHPGADPDQIRLAYRGAESVTLKDTGQMEVTTPLGGFVDKAPVAYQEIDGQLVPVEAAYDMVSPIRGLPSAMPSSRFAFQVDHYDPAHSLVIDPAVLLYTGYLGGSNRERGVSIAVDEAGAAYVTGWASSSESEGFPVLVGPDLSHNGGLDGYWGQRDAFVAKVKADGTGLDYCGYIGGSDDDFGMDITVDGTGTAYVVGTTQSSESEGFPVVLGPDLTYNGGIRDVFVAKVKADGTEMAYCGYVGGSDHEEGYGIAVDGTGGAYVAGWTDSSESEGFPVLVGPDLAYNGGDFDAFVVKVKVDGTGLAYCGYVGGSDRDRGTEIAVGRAGAVYVVGATDSSESEGFPVLVGPDLTYPGYDTGIFVAKVKSNGTGLEYCGYVGASDHFGPGLVDIAADGVGAAYITGWTNFTESDGFPVLVGPDLTYNGGDFDAFVAKVKVDGTELEYCGYIGGSDDDRGKDIAVDGTGAAYIVGTTHSSESEGFPVEKGPDLTHNGGHRDAFVAKVKADGTELEYCGYVGGSNDDRGRGIAVDYAGAAYIVGLTTSSAGEGFPVVVGPDTTHNGSEDVFVAKVGAEEADDTTSPATITDLSARSGGAAGTVDLSWTAPGDDGNTGAAATYVIRHADSSITTLLAWEDATSVDDEPTPQLAGSSQSMTVPGLTPGETYYFAIRSLDEAGNRSGLSNSPGAVASDAPDIGFRPNSNGFQFDNMRICRTEEMFEEYFGTENVKRPDGTWCEGARQFFKGTHAKHGYWNKADCYSCVGFSVGSLLSYLGWSQPDSGRFAIDHFERLYEQPPSGQLKDSIAYYSGVQTGRRYINAYASRDESSCSEKIEGIVQGIRDRQPVILVLKVTEELWHAVVPYLVEEISPTEVDVYVYDSEEHGERQIVHFEDIGSGGQWRYTFVGKLSKHRTDDGMCSEVFTYALQSSIQPGVPRHSFCESQKEIAATDALQTRAFSERMSVRLPPEGDWLAQDVWGRRLGWVNGQLVSEIPDAYHVPQTLGELSVSFRTLDLPEGEYTVEVSDSPGETFGYTVFGDGRFVEMSGRLRSAGSDASLLVDPNLDSATVIGVENLASFRLAMDNESPAESRVATLAGTPLWGTGDLEANFDGDQVTISKAPGDVQYNLKFRKNQDQPFVSNPIRLEFNDTHALSPISWDDLSSTSVLLEVDEDSDGTVDETKVLENQAKHVYLPLVIRLN